MRQIGLQTTITLLSVATALTLGEARTEAATSSPSRHFDIGVTSLASALDAFAEQSHRQIFFSPDDIQDKQTDGFQGDVGPEAALGVLLEGTGLTFRVARDETIVVDGPGHERAANSTSDMRNLRLAQATRDSGVTAVSSPESTQESPSRGAAPPSALTEKDIGEVVVTGSRLQITDFESPTPITIMSAADLFQRAPSNIPDALNTLPAFRAPASPQASRNGNSGQPSITAQGNVLNLRALGASRTLILVDGIRVPPSTANGYVNVDTIPQGLIQRVDTVTGGASAAYGSDAVAGVVNFILDKKFVGLKGSVQGGGSVYGDYFHGKVSLTGGTALVDDRLHLVGNVEASRNQGIPDLYSRPVNADHPNRVGAGSATNPFYVNRDATFANSTFTGLILNGPLAGQQFAPNGTSLIQYTKGAATRTGRITTGGDGAYFQGTSGVPRVSDWSAFGRASFDVTDNIGLFFQASMSEATTYAKFVRAASGPNANAGGTTIYADNAFLPASIAAQLNGQSFKLGKVTPNDDPTAPRTYTDVLSSATSIRTGFEGRIGTDWKWDATYSYGVAKQHIASLDTIQVNNLAAVDAVRAPNGQIVCRVTLTNPTTLPGCVPVDIFGVGNTTQAGWGFITGVNRLSITNKMSIGSVNLNGSLFDDWAGVVKGAIGAEIRHQSLLQPNSTPAFATAGINGIDSSNSSVYYANDNYSGAAGSVNTQEAYTEVNIPLLKDVPFARTVDLDLAGRLTHYSTSGNVVTWKAGLNYQVVDALRLRGTVSRDAAAPSLSQLFGARSGTTTNPPDPHTGSDGTLIIYQGGNPKLKPEKAATFTAGAVFSPVDNLNISLDFYHINIENGISNPATSATNSFAQTILQQCEDAHGTGFSCGLITRPRPFSDTSAANYPISIEAAFVNQATVLQSGIDLEVAYKMSASEIFGSLPGEFSFRGLASNLLKQEVVNTPGASPITQLGDGALGYNRFNGLTTLAYVQESLQVGVTERFVGSARTQLGGIVWAAGDDRLPAAYYTDIAASFNLSHNVVAFLNVANVFNKQPPLRPSFGDMGIFFATNRYMYDVIGTNFTAGIRANL